MHCGVGTDSVLYHKETGVAQIILGDLRQYTLHNIVKPIYKMSHFSSINTTQPLIFKVFLEQHWTLCFTPLGAASLEFCKHLQSNREILHHPPVFLYLNIELTAGGSS